jgi:hypothetical protein
MRHHRFFTLANGDRIVRPPDVIECASNERAIKEANTATRAAEALSITASLRGYFDDLLSPPRPKRTVKMERVVSSVKNCQMVLTRIGETTPSFSEIRNRRALPRVGDLIVFLVAGELVHVKVEQILAPPQGEGTFVVSLKEIVAEGRSL